ncbi:hypothetical protein GTO27_02310, partial [Candidatus Bathyarchaeota archaeon]|nr:hypothetical protein [Candidatus Bathyarchaeota archaeon]
KQVECASCHNPTTDPDPLNVIAPDGELCYICHEKEKIDFSTDYIHPITDKGQCLSCHSPHASDFKDVTLMGKNE